MKNLLKTALVISVFGAMIGTATASAVLDCEGQGVVVSSQAAPETKPNDPVAWMVEVDVKSAHYTGGYGMDESCTAAIKKVTISAPAEKQPGETVDILYHSYSGMTPNGAISSEEWTFKPQPHQP